MKKFKLFKLLALFVVLITGMNAAWAGTWSRTVYFIPKDAWVSNGYSCKVNERYDNAADNWRQADAWNTNKTCGGKPVYACSVEAYDGWSTLGTLQFQAYDGATQKETVVAFDNWGTLVDLADKLYNCNNGAKQSFNTFSFDNIVSGGYVYFDNSSGLLTGTYKYFVIGHESQSRVHALTRLSNTDLWYVYLDNETYHTWTDATYSAFIGSNSSWGDWTTGGSANVRNASQYTATKAVNYSNQISSGKYYLYTPASGSNGAELSREEYNAVTGLNRTQTVYIHTSTNGGSTYGTSVIGGSVKVDRYYMNSSATAASHATAGSATVLSSATNTTGVVLTSDASFTGVANTGYTFVGWSTNTTAPSPDDPSNWEIDGVSGTNTMYSFFRANSYTIAYDANDGTGTTASSTHYYGVAKTLTSNGFSKDGYTFDGWNTEPDGSGSSYTNGQSVTSLSSTQDATVTLYAQWKQVITLDDNGGSKDGSVTVYYLRSSVSNFSEAEKEGYTCDGYYTATSGGYKIFAASTGALSTYSSNISSYVNSSGKWIYDGTPSLSAQWTANTYTISFDADDEDRVGSATNKQANVTVTFDAKDFSVAKVAVPVLAGYTFGGYYTEKDGDGEQIVNASGVWQNTKTGYLDASGNWIKAANTTLYAKWTAQTCTVSFYAGLGTVTPTSSTVTMGATYGEGTGLVGGELPTPTPMDGYVFVGWFTAYEGGTEVTSSTQVTTYLDHTIYAHYTQKLRVYFKNTLGWDSVFVTYDAEWNHESADKGAGNMGKTYHKMTRQGTSDIWYDDIPDACLSSWKHFIAFNNIRQTDYAWFNEGQAVFRRDFDRKTRMFVPTPNDPNKFLKNEGYGKPGTTYYSTDQASGDPAGRYKNGYWVSSDYNTKANYTLKGTWDSWAKDNHIVSTTLFPDSIYVYTIRGLSASTTYQFKLWKLCSDNTTGSVFSSTTAITSSTAADAAIFNAADGGTNASMTTTVAGDYVFMFNFSKDGKVKLTIEYPYKTNDYRVLYSWNDGSAKERASESIHPKASSTKTISMFVHKASDVTSNSLKIQKYNGSTWGDVTGGGITISGVEESGVYNFVITQPASGDPTGELLEKYEGNYYIRLDSAAGGWDQYRVYGSSKMTLSEYSMTQTLSDPYSHYYCQYVDDYGSDISYAIATDFSPNISGTMIDDDVIGTGKKRLPAGAPANVRFSWNEKTNAMRRAYLKSAQGAGNARFLVLHGSDAKVLDEDGNPIASEGEGADQLHANELLFTDNGNWVYEVDLKAQPGAKISLIAKYNGSDRYLIGGASSWETILGGKGSNKYEIRAVYDFKTNRLLTAWTPDKAINDTLSDVDLMLIRERDDAGTAITFGAKGVLDAKKVIGAIQFNYDDMVGSVTSWTPASRLLLKYFISFPFDVNVSDVFGLNSSYGDAYVIMKYNGAKRASKGFFLGDGTTTFWEDLTLDSVMHANEGYCVVLDNDRFNYSFEPIWKNKSAGSSVYLYFPSASNVGNIASVSKTITVPSHECKINRKFYDSESGKWLNHTYTDSHWNMMGVPIFNDHTGDASAEGTPGAIFTRTEIDTTKAIAYFYAWDKDDNQFHIQAANGFQFKVMHSYMVQYTGDVTFTGSAPVPAGIAARRLSEDKNYQIELQVLNNNEDVLNRTYVELRENACDTFALNEDVYMAPDALAASIFTFAGSYDVAANVLSINNHIVPMGVCIRQAGTYTFSMPSNFSGTVTLIDTYTQTRTNLAFGDYSVNMPKGTNVDRFLLEIDINQAPTAIDGVEDGSGSLKDGKAHKFIENGVMYIMKNGEIFDARGNRVR